MATGDQVAPGHSLTLFAQISELLRERNARKNYYPKLVGSNRLTAAKADFQMRCLDAAIKSLEKLEALENNIQKSQ